MVLWDDEAPKQFLKEYSSNSMKHREMCVTIGRKLVYRMVAASEVKGLPCKLYSSRIKFYETRIDKGKLIGTLFAIRVSDMWIIKDGNHRLRALRIKKVNEYRIAYAKEK